MLYGWWEGGSRNEGARLQARPGRKGGAMFQVVAGSRMGGKRDKTYFGENVGTLTF